MIALLLALQVIDITVGQSRFDYDPTKVTSLNTTATYKTVIGETILVPITIKNKLPLPTDALDAKSIGLKGDGSDEQNALQNALNRCKTEGKQLYLTPPGTYAHSGKLTANGVTIFSDGNATLKALNATQSSLYLIGTNPRVSGVNFTFNTIGVARQSNWNAAMIIAYQATGTVIENVKITGSPSVGIFVINSTGTTIRGANVFGTLADAIHISSRSSNVLVENSVTDSNGDDGFAVVSYVSNGGKCSGVTFNNCVAKNNYWGRGFAVLGGDGIVYNNCTASKNAGAGFYFYAEDSWNTYGSTGIKVTNCKTEYSNQNAGIGGHPGVYIRGRVSYPVNNVTIEGMTIAYPKNDGYKCEGNLSAIMLKGTTFIGIPSGKKQYNILTGGVTY